MSSGLVICSVCRREVHQGAGMKWFHCEDDTPMHPTAFAKYATRAEVVGKACFRDDFE